MRYKSHLLAFLLTFVIILSTYSDQYKPRIAVMPFSPIGVSKNDAKVVTGLFETGLVKTESFNVIEQQQINEILSVQSFTLTGCTDDACAIEFGKLLAAEQVIFGDLSILDGKFILNVKIIDVELGSNIKADSVETLKLAEITSTAELLAFKLAGLIYSEGKNVQIANAFRDVFIETDPAGADIYINGVKKGVSPGLFEKVPLGSVIIEGEKDNLYGILESRITEKTNTLNFRLKVTYGNILIKSTYQDLDVYLDDNFIGKLGSGFFSGITVGEHSITLDGNGYIWEGSVDVVANKSITIEAEPEAVGYFEGTIPSGATAVLSNSVKSMSLTGVSEIYLPIGEYNIIVSHDDYVTTESLVTIKHGEVYHFNPILVPNQETIDRRNRETKIVRLKEVRGRRVKIEDEIRQLNHTRNNKNIGGWVSAGSSVLSAGLFGLFSIFSNSAYDDYISTTISADAANYKEKVQLWDILSYVSLGTTAIGAGLSTYFFMSKPSIEDLSQEYLSLGIEQLRLEGELR